MNRAILARELCPSCYDRFWRNGWLSYLPRTRSVQEKILDVLEADGGWLTTSGVKAALPLLNPDSVQKELFRSRTKRLVESRPTPRVGRIAENEWRLA